MTLVEQTGVAMRLLIDGDICRRDGMHARQRVHCVVSLADALEARKPAGRGRTAGGGRAA